MSREEELADSLQNVMCEVLFDGFAEAIAQELVLSQEAKGPLLMSRGRVIEQKKKKLLEDLKQKIGDQSNRISKGVEVAKKHLPEHFNKQEIEEVEKELEEATHILLTTLFQREEIGEVPLQETLKLSKKTLFSFYTVGYELYKQENYQDALSIFTLLNFLNNYVFDYWIAKGLAHKMCQEPLDAVMAFTIASTLFPELPEPYAQNLEVYLSQKQLEEAKEELLALTTLIQNNQALQERWQPLIEHYQKQIDQG